MKFIEKWILRMHYVDHQHDLAELRTVPKFDNGSLITVADRLDCVVKARLWVDGDLRAQARFAVTLISMFGLDLSKNPIFVELRHVVNLHCVAEQLLL